MAVASTHSAGGWGLLGYVTAALVSAGLLAWLGLSWLVAQTEGVSPDDLGKVDMVVALAGSPDRALYAKALVTQGVAPDSMTTLVDPYCLRLRGVRTVCRTSVRNTIDEAVILRRIFARERVSGVIVVTSRYHLARASAVFATVFAGAGTTIRVVAPPGDRLSAERVGREALSYLPSLIAAALARSMPAAYEWLVRHQQVCPDPADSSTT